MTDWRKLADAVYENTCLGLLIAALVACAMRSWGLGLLLVCSAAYAALLGGWAAFMAVGVWLSGRGDE